MHIYAFAAYSSRRNSSIRLDAQSAAQSVQFCSLFSIFFKTRRGFPVLEILAIPSLEVNRQGLPDCCGATLRNCAVHSVDVSRGID